MSLTNSQYDSLMRSYDARQAANRQFVAERTQELYSSIPQLSSIDEAKGKLRMEQVSLRLQGKEEQAESIAAQLEALIAQEERLIRNAGFAPDFLTPPYTCPTCKDTGYVGQGPERTRCHCFIQASIDTVYSQSNLAHISSCQGFSAFNLSFYSKDIIDAEVAEGLSAYDEAKETYEKCLNFVQNFDTSNDNLLLRGNTGTGKTFLSTCIAKDLLDQRHSVVYYSAQQLVDIFESAALRREPEAAVAKDQVFTCDLLIIDDLGSELTNSFTNTHLFSCLNERLLLGKSTIISTNHTLAELRDKYTERIFSRIMSNYTLCKLFGADIRIQKKLNN